MSAAEVLRRMLDERGVRHQDHYWDTSWIAGGTLHMATGQLDGTLVVDKLTPEQAIAATLGEQTAKSGADALSRRARDMARSIQGNLGRSLYRRKDVAEMQEVSETLMELANELSATLNEPKPPCGGGYCPMCSATLGKVGSEVRSGKLTAEQVEKVIMSSDYWERVNNHPALREGVWQAIADELNVTLWSDERYDAGFANGVKATLHQLDGLITGGYDLKAVCAWIDNQ